MFQINDLIFYGSTGICRITDITTREVKGTNEGQLYYILSPLYHECAISAPIGSDKVFMRPIISKDEAERLIDSISSIDAQPYNCRSINELERHYKSFFQSRDCADLIDLLLSIYVKKKQAEELKRKFGTVDERFMKQAEELLFGELSVALDIPKDGVRSYIAKRVEEAETSECDQ